MCGKVQRLLDRELTSEELSHLARIRKVFEQRRAVRATIRQIAEQDPGLFFPVALALLESAPDPKTYPNLYPALLDYPEFLIQLIRPDRFSRDRAVEAFRDFIKFDKRLDIRMARLVPGRNEDKYQLEAPCIVRILEILNEISVGSKLVLMMNHLTGHPDPRVASKAILVMGRRIQNSSWAERHAKSEDPRKRASVVEALWGRNNAWCRQALWTAVKDQNNRVAGNALVGLDLLGEPRASDLAKYMLRDPRVPFRFTAAWVMGKMGDLEFLESLRTALADPDQHVRQAARRALVTIRRPIVRQQQLETVALAESVQAATEETGKALTEPEEKKPSEYPDFSLHLDGSYTSRP